MFYTDYHMHSIYSDDAKDTMLDMARAASRRGVNKLCFTDHADECCDPKCLSFNPNIFLAQEGIYEDYEKVRDIMRGEVDVRFGVELASINHDSEKASLFINDPRFDFIIGSVHNVRAHDDFYYMKYESEAQCREILLTYLEEYMEIVELGGCDVLGHVGYPQKYMVRHGFKSSVLDHEEALRELFKRAVERGIGIEVNTSGLRGLLSSTIPCVEAIKMYRELGGEIITAGSDSHKTADAGVGIRKAYDILRACGFKYITTFKNHKPEFSAI